MSEHIGYTETFSEWEYGVFLDRREQGLGYSLVATGQHVGVPLAAAARDHGEGATYQVRRRLVTRSPWQALPAPPVTVPEPEGGDEG